MERVAEFDLIGNKMRNDINVQDQDSTVDEY